MISPVFWTENRKYAFQFVGGFYRLYNEEGDFVKEFRSFKKMLAYIMQKEELQ